MCPFNYLNVAAKKTKTSKKGKYAGLLSKARKENALQPLAEDANGFWILPRDRKERNAYLTRIFSKELSKHETFSARMKIMQQKANIPRGSLYRLADAMDWRRFVREDSEVKEMRQLAELLGTPDDVNLSGLTAQTKNFLYMGIVTSSSIVRHCGRMINFYAVKLEQMIINCDGLDNLSVAQKAEFDHYESRLLFYKNELTPFINTQALTRGLSMLGVGVELADAVGQMEGGAMTPQMLQQKLLDLGLVNMQRIPGGAQGSSVSDRSFDDIVKDIELPNLDGRAVKHQMFGVAGSYSDDDRVSDEELEET